MGVRLPLRAPFTMRVLVLDDNHNRLRAFRQRLIGHVVVCVETAKEAIEQLEKEEFEIVFLDHDLGGEENVPSGPGTGWEVAQWLSEHEDRQPATIYIHSFNGPGSKNMLSLLPRARYVPGVWTMINNPED